MLKAEKNAVAIVDAKATDAKKEPKPYKKVIDSSAVTQKGLIDIHKIDNKYLFEVSDSILGSEMMTITRYSKTQLEEVFLVEKKSTGKWF